MRALRFQSEPLVVVPDTYKLLVEIQVVFEVTWKCEQPAKATANLGLAKAGAVIDGMVPVTPN